MDYEKKNVLTIRLNNRNQKEYLSCMAHFFFSFNFVVVCGLVASLKRVAEILICGKSISSLKGICYNSE